MPSEYTYKDILLYKTEACRNWDERGFCRYGKRCRYAHGPEELRHISRSNQYKTKTCKAYHEGGSCPYGIRCTFIHHTSDKTSSTLNTQISSPESRVLPVALHNHNVWDSMLGLSNYNDTHDNRHHSTLYNTLLQ